MTSVSVERLRNDFDESFTLPPREVEDDVEAFLAIRVGDRPYALSILELGGIAVDQRLTPVPSSNTALLGLSSSRGRALAVFDLASLLGESRRGESPRWVALSAGAHPIGFAFAELEGHVRVRPSELAQITGAHGHMIARVIRTTAEQRPVIQVKAALALVGGAALQDGEKEANNE